MAEKETEKQTGKKVSDYEEVVNEVAEELLAQLAFSDDGSVIEMFEAGNYDPWQLFLFFGVVEKALLQYRTDKRCKTVYIQVPPEGLATHVPPVTPISTLLKHLSFERIDDFMNDRLETGRVVYNSQEMVYEGADVKNRHVVILCDIMRKGSDYLNEIISLCHENKASHVVAVPLMLWNPELEEPSDNEGQGKSNEGHRLS